MAVINKEWMQNVYKTPRIKAESLPFNHIAWFKIHCAGIQRQNCKSYIVQEIMDLSVMFIDGKMEQNRFFPL